MVNHKKKINQKDWDIIHGNNEKGVGMAFNFRDAVGILIENEPFLNITYFGTLEGSLGVVISLPKDTYEFLNSLQTEILKVISSTGGFDYEKWRAFKVNRYLL
jgi:hypothetical protein